MDDLVQGPPPEGPAAPLSGCGIPHADRADRPVVVGDSEFAQELLFAEKIPKYQAPRASSTAASSSSIAAMAVSRSQYGTGQPSSTSMPNPALSGFE